MRPADEQSSLRVTDRELLVEVFRPRGPGPFPGLVVLHALYGLNDDIRRISARFADEGYLTAAPDLLAGGLKLGCIARAMRTLRDGEGPMVHELEALIERLASRPDVTRVGAVGFCMGGGFALLLGTRERISAAGVFYSDTRPREELARVCPVVGGWGGKDRTFAQSGRRLVRDLEDLGKEHDIRIYEDAGHSYLNDAGRPLLAWLSRPLLHVEYNEPAAEDSWRRMLGFFGRHLGEASP
jgi:carboxymethylenebutenolidase